MWMGITWGYHLSLLPYKPVIYLDSFIMELFSPLYTPGQEYWSRLYSFFRVMFPTQGLDPSPTVDFYQLSHRSSYTNYFMKNFYFYFFSL